MKTNIGLDAIFVPSENIVARQIEGELIIVPLVAGIGDMEDELYTLNNTGRAIWHKLDGKKRLKDLLLLLSKEFDGSEAQIKKDVIGLLSELIKRGLVTRVPESQ